MCEAMKWHSISSTYPPDEAWEILENMEFDSGFEDIQFDEGDDDWEDEL